ncbi:MAG: hypothetical protein HY925_02310 [Elusimicrobia bacterium]|nr:hypothetical protein [Elusimicrobiota bacterium]
MRRWLARVGLALSLAAYAVLAFHVDHADADHSAPAHHCCPCHAYTATPNAEAAVAAPATALERLVAARELPAASSSRRTPGAPRAPPVA